MKRGHSFLLWYLLLGLIIISSLVSAQSDHSSARKQLSTAYARLNEAMKQGGQTGPKHLQKVLEDIMAPGELREQMLTGVKQTIAAGGDKSLKKMLRHRLTMQKLRVKGNKAVATVVQTADAIRTDDEGLYGVKGKEHRLRGTVIYRDVWEKMGKKWEVTSTKTVKETVYVDGKVWKPTPKPGKE